MKNKLNVTIVVLLQAAGVSCFTRRLELMLSMAFPGRALRD
ncbi:MAG: hypothetical protein M0036_02670 [Desulfobacteraceae bacterium]|nr:hypothetical protein [Desulfobacteraceae bacterium]